MKPKLGVLLVDDERLARGELRTLLKPHPELEVVGEAADVEEAVQRIAELDPDVLFLDVQMPGASGFELLSRVEVRAQVVFVTAYDAHALRAFEVNALDYLLKPVHPQRLRATVERLLQHVGPELPGAGTGAARPLAVDDHLFLSGERRARFVQVGELACVCSAGDYSELVTRDGQRYLLPRPLAEWEARLPERQFVRIHRGTIVNLACVDRVETEPDEGLRVHVRGIATPFPMSRRYAAQLKLRLA
ncbi:LytR/AlgR family response regulator transcription factor [Pyxidicoccus xibeiensis]|uniref:LytR/AlgR family response regulator transcription factor n=1 Tax=Pyxidicoccus xibeiensis TaxID=2906759 RepID=UPI0020A72F25|nr:LytTR family DNA-binding domain-containing protein [Pyxidicoccus xibeiensis]MCP3136288.1 LytTR family DNA-binding domain-containing protein [Pyxidicoccus xibeiensis]